MEQNPSSQEDFIKNVLEQLAPIYKDYQEKKMIIEQLQIEKDTEVIKAEFIVIEKMDNRDKYFKVIIVTICLVALSVVAFIDKLQGVSPIIGVIIGLALKSNSMNDFLGSSKSTDTDN